MSAAFSVCPAPRSFHVLAVEAQGAPGTPLADVVNALGHVAIRCRRYEDAFASIESEAFDLVVCQDLDRSAVTELGAWMLLRYPEIPLLRITADDGQDLVATADSSVGVGSQVASLSHLAAGIERAMATRGAHIGSSDPDEPTLQGSDRSSDRSSGPSHDRNALAQHFTIALDGLYLVFQPVVRSKTNCVVGYEVLLRTTSARFQKAGPLLAVARRLGRLQDVDDRVRELLALHFEDADQWRTFFVNASVSELTDGVLGTDADPLLPYASRIVMEFSQDFPIPLTRDVLATLDRMRAAGYRIAAGDISSTTASLVRLRVLAPDIYKLGAALVHRCDTSAVKRRYITEVVTMAHTEGAWVVAQGIERTEEHLTAVELGCDLTQGFLLGIPRATFD